MGNEEILCVFVTSRALLCTIPTFLWGISWVWTITKGPFFAFRWILAGQQSLWSLWIARTLSRQTQINCRRNAFDVLHSCIACNKKLFFLKARLSPCIVIWYIHSWLEILMKKFENFQTISASKGLKSLKM